ncbi:hypothetical protein D3C84_1195350 [compost metagenome]
MHVQPALYFAIELGCGRDNRQVHVAGSADDGVELLHKIDCRSEHSAMDVQPGGPVMTEADGHRFESIVRQRLIGPNNNAC